MKSASEAPTARTSRAGDASEASVARTSRAGAASGAPGARTRRAGLSLPWVCRGVVVARRGSDAGFARDLSAFWLVGARLYRAGAASQASWGDEVSNEIGHGSFKGADVFEKGCVSEASWATMSRAGLAFPRVQRLTSDVRGRPPQEETHERRRSADSIEEKRLPS